ncbi:c-type cytochrome biogenesis protein CcsB [Nocardioides phosphati]|uniref:C-type cytochrome biogenesis protein CcsB n=1 Tax=Nocardioides phosphati TaxID=1867775 RepID=A0ABQ2N6B3_9ACTN|nr:c-type cytochrome biogenesis protein CcsB [Nocardioides phosphati]GGO84936.1 c-type cytochrome biogenesis protein CcsB [Nocardioides phosphati]
MTRLQLAQFSNQAIMFAAIVYALAMLAHIVEWAATRSTAPGRILVGPDGAELPSAGSDLGGAERPYRVDLWGRYGIALTMVGLLLNAAGVLARGLAADRVPWGNMYEFTITGCVATVLTYLIMLRFQPIRWLGLPVTALVVVLLMLAVLLLDVPAAPLVPALHSYWLYIHVTAAMLATGSFTVGALASVLFLVRNRAERRGTAGTGISARLPEADVIDTFAYRVHAFGFPVWTFAALIAGPIWARYAWGRYWGWDPKEVWAFVTWVAYAAYLHARATAGWRGKGAAILALVGFAALLYNFVGINLWGGGLHSYAGK